MTSKTPELKRVVTEIIGPKASSVLMNRLLAAVDDASDAHSAAVKVEKIVALFLGPDQAQLLRSGFAKVI